ncbi:MAG: serine protease [Acidobacteriota bacterium]
MVSRRVVFLSSVLATAVSFFTLGLMQARRSDASVRAASDARFEALRDEVYRELGREPVPAGTSGEATRPPAGRAPQGSRARMVAEIKEELQSEMGLLPVHLLRERSSSFVELYADDNFGKTSYGTAGYLGGGYFVTVKHAVVALKDEDNRQGARRIVAIKIVDNGKEIPATVVDAGAAEVEVDSGDWAIIKTRELDLPPLTVDTAFAYNFAEPIFRLGNDYSKGIIVSTGYVGQKTAGGLVTCLTDGHPGVSGGGVLDQRGHLVGVPIGRMQGDYRFSFILPMRSEMLRKVPAFGQREPAVAVASLR